MLKKITPFLYKYNKSSLGYSTKFVKTRNFTRKTMIVSNIMSGFGLFYENNQEMNYMKFNNIMETSISANKIDDVKEVLDKIPKNKINYDYFMNKCIKYENIEILILLLEHNYNRKFDGELKISKFIVDINVDENDVIAFKSTVKKGDLTINIARKIETGNNIMKYVSKYLDIISKISIILFSMILYKSIKILIE